MKVRTLATALLCVSAFLRNGAFAEDNASTGEDPFKFTLEVDNIKSNKGNILIAFYDSAETFMKTPFLKIREPSIGKGAMVFDVRGVKGQIAFVVMHDKNANNKMDNNLVGYPKEPFAFSNDAKVRLGPPTFEEAVLFIDGSVDKITVKLQ